MPAGYDLDMGPRPPSTGEMQGQTTVSNAVADARQGAAILGLNVARAVLNVTSIIIFLGIHWVLNVLSERLLPGWERGRTFLEAVFFAGFAVVYVHQVFDMVVIFIPGLRQNKRQRDI